MALVCVAGALAGTLDPGLPPGGNFDLSHWYLQLPTSNGILTAASGSVDSFSSSQLVAGATNAHFFTGPDGAMTFRVPDNGARTGGSSHPRSELRELMDGQDTGVNWTLYGTHVLTATCVVSEVPADTQKVCIGQIHEPNTKPDGSASANNEQMIMFNLANHTIYVNINLDGNLSSSFSKTVISGPSVALGNVINYTLSVVNGLLTIVINNTTNSWDLFSGTNYQGHIAQNWDAASGNTVYFKAGNYSQTTNQCGCSTDVALVAFYSLNRYHAPDITNQPESLVVNAGSNVAFAIGALGNGSLSYQWWFNATNRLARATNASITITNAQTPNAGSYSVVVSDSFGSVTSTPAVLTLNLPPAIMSQPQSQSATQSLDATFVVAASGSPPLGYQWRFAPNVSGIQATNIAGATGSSYTRNNVQPVHAGNYSVVVADAAGAAVSSNALLTLYVPRPVLQMTSPEIVRWQGLSNLNYTVKAMTNYETAEWQAIGTAASTTTTVSFTNPPSGDDERFYRVIYQP